jgi:hypothetical protein
MLLDVLKLLWGQALWLLEKRVGKYDFADIVQECRSFKQSVVFSTQEQML